MPRRILVGFPVGQIGGAERLLLHLLQRLDRKRCEPSAFVVGRGDLAPSLASLNVPHWTFPSHRFRQVRPVTAAAGRIAHLVGR